MLVKRDEFFVETEDTSNCLDRSRQLFCVGIIENASA